VRMYGVRPSVSDSHETHIKLASAGERAHSWMMLAVARYDVSPVAVPDFLPRFDQCQRPRLCTTFCPAGSTSKRKGSFLNMS
jgi:hypothetical protein